MSKMELGLKIQSNTDILFSCTQTDKRKQKVITYKYSVELIQSIFYNNLLNKNDNFMIS